MKKIDYFSCTAKPSAVKIGFDCGGFYLYRNLIIRLS